jgi:hypothetical protein
MSAKLMGQVWDLKLSHGQQIILLALADHAHDDGTHCYPGVPYLAHKTGYTERNVTRILSELEADGIIESEDRSGGRGRVAGYVLRLEKGDKKDDYKPRQVGQRVKSQPVKGDKSAENPDKSDKKGDKSARANIEEPSENHQEEPKAEGATLPDDTTAACLLLLSRVKKFPRDQGENVLYLAELRTEFPAVNAREVCRQYEVWHRDNPGKTTNFRSRLRNFFESAEKRHRSGKPDTAHQGGMSREQREKRRQEGRTERKPDLPEDFDPEAVKREWEARKAKGDIGLGAA